MNLPNVITRAQPSLGPGAVKALNPMAQPPALLASAIPAAPVNPKQITNRLRAVVDRPLNGMTGDVLRFALNNNSSDAEQILAYLSAFLLRFARMPQLRAAAVQIIAGLGDHNIPGQVTALVNFVKSRMEYVRDPAGVEFIISPLWSLNEIAQGRRPAGDCDDHVLLLGSLLGAIGFDVRPVAVHLYDAKFFDHVILQANLGPQYGNWVDLDPCAKSLPQPVYETRLVPAQ